MQEAVFYDAYGVTITNARCILPEQTYVLGAITSVRVDETPAPKSAAFLAAWLGAAMVAFGLLFGFNGNTGGFAAALVGAILVWGGVRDYRAARAWHHVLITTAAGERRALSSRDPEAIQDVAGAINRAVVHRAIAT